jgi:hypothetical protein
MTMGVRMMGRADFCKLVGLEVEQLNVMRRRDQVPSVPNLNLSEEIANESGYEAGGALALIIANELAERYEISRKCAARIASFSRSLFLRWKEVSTTSAQLAAGKKPSAEILFAVIEWPIGGPKRKATHSKVAVGTLTEIADEYPNASTVIAVSATQCAALLRERADRARIDLEEFWKQ